jgi:hypothetical protein
MSDFIYVMTGDLAEYGELSRRPGFAGRELRRIFRPEQFRHIEGAGKTIHRYGSAKTSPSRQPMEDAALAAGFEILDVED